MIERPTKPCNNPACDRVTTAMYCCGPCDTAHAWKYDPDGYHSEGCNQRHIERGGKQQLPAGEAP